MRSIALLPLLVLAAGCNSEPGVTATNASVEEVQKQVADAGGTMQMRPGRWEGTIAVKNVLPPGIGGGAQPEVSTQPLKACVTPEQVKPGANPFLAQLQQGCKYDDFKMADGKIAATTTCARPGMTMKSVVTGEFTADDYKLVNVTEVSGAGAGPMAGMKAHSTIAARRTGECRGDEDQQ